MSEPFTYLRNRFIAELPLWRLRPWQLALLILWSAWPWIAGAVLPGKDTLALAPVIVFLPIGYVVGGAFMAVMPGFKYAYPLGVSCTIFFLSYLVLVSWRACHVARPKS